jgi:carotenoid cleavage dioxygenase-like enzyme
LRRGYLASVNIGQEARMTDTADNDAPVATECDAHHLLVRGELPRELNGTLFRNGPNPQFPAGHHWFLGDGMIHAFTLRDGCAAYRNRWYGRRNSSPSNRRGIR